LKAQFVGLNPNDPPSWPAFPRYLLCVAVTAAVIAALWFVWLSSSDEELMAERATEVKLREDFTKKLGQAASLDALRKQREQVQQYVTQIEKQLPSKAEMDALLSDINQAGLGRSLQFELFRPGQVNVKEYYAELPIAVRVTGRYHDMGAFAADIANLSRIVTLNNLTLTPAKEGTLTMDTTAKTFRYLDNDEVALQRKTAAPAKADKK
jgi:type IV pilus assembly protein PilO